MQREPHATPQSSLPQSSVGAQRGGRRAHAAGQPSGPLHVDGALHVRVQTAAVLIHSRRGERLGVTLALEEHRGPLLALRQRDLVRRVVTVGPRHGLPGLDRQFGRPEREPRDANVSGARLHRDGPTRRLPGEPGQRDHEVLLGVGLVALEARLVIRLVVELLIWRERRVLPVAVPYILRVLRAPARPLLHHGDPDEVAFDESAVGVLGRVAGTVDLRLVLDQGQHRAARNRLPLTGRLDGVRGAVELAILLVVVAVDRGVEHVILVVRRERDLLGAGAARNHGQGDDRCDHGQDDGYFALHRISSRGVVTLVVRILLSYGGARRTDL